MKSFIDFVEAQSQLKLFNPQHEPESQPHTPFNQIHPEIIDKVLSSMGIGGRRGLNQRNFQTFKKLLSSSLQEPLKSLVNKEDDPNAFKPLVDSWKRNNPQINLAKIGGVKPQEEQPTILEPSKHKQVTPSDIVHEFPPVGSDLSLRLQWVLQYERTNTPIFDHIINFLLTKKYRPEDFNFKDNTEELLGRNELKVGEQRKIKQALEAYRQSVLISISRNKVPLQIISDLLDNLAENRIARIMGDELIFLAEQIIQKPSIKITQEIVYKAIQRFKNQKYFGESIKTFAKFLTNVR